MPEKKDIVLITGCNGLIGAPTVNRLAEKYRIIGFDIDEPEDFPADGAYFNVDLTSDESVSRALQNVGSQFGNHVRSVIHLAAYYDFSGEPSPMYDALTVRGTERLLRALHTFQVDQFVFSSTMLVHPPTDPGKPIHEECPLEPKWDYPKSKVEAEQVIRSQRGTIPVVLLRIAGVYDDYCRSIPLAHQIQRIYERRLTSRVFPGDLSHGQAFLHLEDLVGVFQLLVQRAGTLPEIVPMLVGEPETLSYGYLQSQLGKLIHNEEWETKEIPKTVAKAGAWVQDNFPFVGEPFIKPWMIEMADDHYELDVRRAAELLIWSPTHSLRNALPNMVSALKDNPAEWYRDHNLKMSAKLKQTHAAST